MNITSIKSFIHSKTFTTVLITVASLAGAFIIFHAGIAVGYRRAQFANTYGDSFVRTFGPRGGHGGGPSGMLSDEPFGGHGAAGAILSMTTDTITIEDRSGTEKTIHVSASTIIKQYRDTITLDKLTTGDMIVVLGTPNDTGTIEAKLIRILPSPEEINAQN